MKQRKHRTAAERAAAIAAWQASGETADVWATAAGIAPSTFARWRAMAVRASRDLSPVGFVRLAAGSPMNGTDGAGLSREWMLEVGEMRVRLSRGTAWDDVSRILAILRSPP